MIECKRVNDGRKEKSKYWRIEVSYLGVYGIKEFYFFIIHTQDGYFVEKWNREKPYLGNEITYRNFHISSKKSFNHNVSVETYKKGFVVRENQNIVFDYNDDQNNL